MRIDKWWLANSYDLNDIPDCSMHSMDASGNVYDSKRDSYLNRRNRQYSSLSETPSTTGRRGLHGTGRDLRERVQIPSSVKLARSDSELRFTSKHENIGVPFEGTVGGHNARFNTIFEAGDGGAAIPRRFSLTLCSAQPPSMTADAGYQRGNGIIRRPLRGEV